MPSSLRRLRFPLPFVTTPHGACLLKGLYGFRRATGLRAWLTMRLAASLGVSPGLIDPAEPFARYGLDSATALGMAGEIAAALNLDLDPTVFWDYPSVDALAAHLAERAASASTSSGIGTANGAAAA